MEDSGDNPFADPKTLGSRSGGYGANGTTTNNNNPNAGLSSSMFEDYDPFGDVGAQPVASQAPTSKPDPLEGYNPFEHKGPPPSAPAAPAAPSAPAVLTNDPPPPYSQASAQQVNTDHYLSQ